ncbi:uncharacterized protein, partial [Chaetodon trifascialis]|uniref:uncharacterized protein n=1 Tax=Chaetodon trifascialis TaxID=109706 RepID=UPI003992ADEC
SSTHSNTNSGSKNNRGSSSQGGYPRQPGQPNQGGYPPQSGRPEYPGSYPRQPGGEGYQYPVQGSPYGAGQGRHDGYGGGYINRNPKNKILSPRYGGSFGYGGHGYRGGSPFAQSVQTMGVYPEEKSREFGRRAMMAAAGGAMAGMALGYGLGRFPRPHFNFRSQQEEYYYNHYMYKKYGTRSTDTNDYGRDYSYSQPPQHYDNYMDDCMKRRDLLPAENQQPNRKPAATNKTTTTAVPSAPDSGSNTTKSNSTAASNSSTSAPSTPQPQNQTGANPEPPASQALGKTATDDDDDDDDTVSIVEIGYPALINQLKVRRCLALYMVYSEKYLRKVTGGAQGLEVGSQGLLAFSFSFTSTVLMLLNSNMLMLH